MKVLASFGNAHKEICGYHERRKKEEKQLDKSTLVWYNIVEVRAGVSLFSFKDGFTLTCSN